MKTNKLKSTFLFVSAAIFVAACSKKTAPTETKKEEYTGPKVTYMADVAPLVQRSCAPCHFPSQNGKKVPLDGFAAVKKELPEILHHVQLPQSNVEFMPYKLKKEPLSPEEIELLKNWARGGFIQE